METINKTYSNLKKEQPGPINVNRSFKDWRYPKYNFSDQGEINLLKHILIKCVEDEFYEDNRKLEMTPEIKKNLAFCIKWITGNGINIYNNKGIALIGGIGIAKSAILKAVYRIIDFFYDTTSIYITANELAHIYRRISQEEEMVIKRNKILTYKLLFIDDIGTEDKKIFDSYPIMEIIRERYDRKRITSYSTNIITKQEMINTYSESIEDKMNHGTYCLEFTGPSKRDTE